MAAPILFARCPELEWGTGAPSVLPAQLLSSPPPRHSHAVLS